MTPAGPVAATIAEMAWVLIVGAGVVFAIVMGVLAWALLHRRAAAAPAFGVRATWAWVVGGGVVFPVVVLSALLVYATLRTAALTPPREPHEPVITVKAHQWWWEVRVRDPARGIDLVLANEVHLPAGRAVTLGLVSADVIHSFWVPALAGKVDMVPGRVHQLRVQVDVPGVHRGQCAEFCGAQHARMALHVVAHSSDDYERWLVAQARPAEPPRDALAQRGAQVFAEQRCSACHTVRGLGPGASLGPTASLGSTAGLGPAASLGPGAGLGPTAGLGPDLTHVGSRLHLGAGTLPTSEASLREWVAHTQRVKPGVRMPSHAQLDADSLRALAAFLGQLR